MKKRGTLALIAAMVVVAAGIFASFFLANPGDSYTITLPGQGSAEIDTSYEIGESNRNQVHTIAVNASNIQAIVASLRRPEVYHCRMSISYFYQDTKTALNSELWKNADYVRISQSTADGGEGQQALLSDKWVYLWGADGSYHRYARQESDADLYSRTPSYEDLIRMKPEQVLVGELRELDGQLCLYAETLDDLTGEMETWHILVENGLLLLASGSLDGKNTYISQMTELRLEIPEDFSFALPDGTQPE